MTKKEIVKAISEELDLTQLRTKEIVQRTFDLIVETLVTEGRIELRNFGVFEVRRREPRVARNPRTNEKVMVEEKHVVAFKPGKEMHARIQEAMGEDGNGKPAAAAGERPADHHGPQPPPRLRVVGDPDDELPLHEVEKERARREDALRRREEALALSGVGEP